jgi:hypothetical protein
MGKIRRKKLHHFGIEVELFYKLEISLQQAKIAWI